MSGGRTGRGAAVVAAAVVVAVVLGGASGGPPAARACGNAVELSRSKLTKMIADAEVALAAGRYKRVIDILDKDGTMMAMGRLWFTALDAKVACRAKVVIGMAYLRVKDRYALETAASVGNCLQATPDDPLLRARAAEVQVAGTDRLQYTAEGRAKVRAEAKTTLEELAKSDLLAEPEAWATLARLRLDAGEEDEARAAAKACRKMTKRKGVCPSAD